MEKMARFQVNFVGTSSCSRRGTGLQLEWGYGRQSHLPRAAPRPSPLDLPPPQRRLKPPGLLRLIGFQRIEEKETSREASLAASSTHFQLAGVERPGQDELLFRSEESLRLAEREESLQRKKVGKKDTERACTYDVHTGRGVPQKQMK